MRQLSVWHIALLVGSAALGTLVLAAPASADRTYDSQIAGFADPWGVTVDPADNVWISDVGNGLISKYDSYPSLTKVGEQNGAGAPNWSGSYARSIAVGSNGYFYVADSGPVAIDIFDNTGAFFKSVQQGFGGGYLYTATDNSGGATSGRFYVASTNNRVQAFDANGDPVNFSGSADYIEGNQINGTPGAPFTPFGQPWNVAVDGSGNIYVVDKANAVVDVFAPSGIFTRSFTGAGAPGGFSSNLTGVAVDPTSENVLVVDQGNKVIDEFDPTGVFVQQIVGTGPSESTLLGTLNGGVAVNSNGYLYVADGANHVVDIFTPGAILPKITYGAVTNLHHDSATLNASVNPNGGPDVTSCEFQYGTTTGYGLSSPCSPGTPYSSTTAASADISGLSPEMTYNYRIVVTTTAGTTKGANRQFIPHAVSGLTTDPANPVARNTATLNGSFVGEGQNIHYYFEWGPTNSYGHTTTVIDAGTPSGPESVHADLTALQTETTYHFRFVASGSEGTTYGGDRAFETLSAVDGLTTNPADELTASSATLRASYNGVGEDLHYYFEWGPTTAYGHTTAEPPGTDDGLQTGPRGISSQLTDLQTHTTYHYRVVAKNDAGISVGADRTFSTAGRYEFSDSWGSLGGADGQLRDPQDIAVDDATGDVYVADTGNHRIVEFDSSGDFHRTWGRGVSDGGAASQICTSACQAGISGSDGGQFATPTFVEVDNSTGPSAGDIYVADTTDGVVQKFDSSGNLITSWGVGGTIDRSHDGRIDGITVDTHGSLFVSTHNAPSYWTELSPDGAYQAQIATDPIFRQPAGGTGIEIDAFGAFYTTVAPGQGGVLYTNPDPEKSPQSAGQRLYRSEYPADNELKTGLAVNRLTTETYVDGGDEVNQFVPGAQCSFFLGCAASDSFGSGHLGAGAGLAINPTSEAVYVADVGNDNVAVFSPLPIPDVTTGSATGSGPTAGTISGHVGPNGPGTVSDCHFEYGTDSSYGLGSVPCSPGVPQSSLTDVSADLSGLTPFTTYHYRLVAIRGDGNGFPAYGDDRTFTPMPGLAPTVLTTSTGEVTPTTAVLGAEINPNSAPTVYSFEYGTEPSYGSQTPSSDSIGEDDVGHGVDSAVTALDPGTLYHFRVVATNLNGTVRGPDHLFGTPDRPKVGGASVSDIARASATLRSQVSPGFRATTFHFEYGRTPAYGLTTSESGSIGSDNLSHDVSGSIVGLSTGTTYHFRVVATNSIGTTQGSDQVFRTAVESVVQPPPPPACKKGQVRRKGKCVKKRQKHKHRKRGNRHG